MKWNLALAQVNTVQVFHCYNPRYIHSVNVLKKELFKRVVLKCSLYLSFLLHTAAIEEGAFKIVVSLMYAGVRLTFLVACSNGQILSSIDNPFLGL